VHLQLISLPNFPVLALGRGARTATGPLRQCCNTNALRVGSLYSLPHSFTEVCSYSAKTGLVHKVLYTYYLELPTYCYATRRNENQARARPTGWPQNWRYICTP